MYIYQSPFYQALAYLTVYVTQSNKQKINYHKSIAKVDFSEHMHLSVVNRSDVFFPEFSYLQV